jgi:hypothetical protein
VTGESVEANATVTNAGGQPGSYNLTLTREARVVDYATGELAPDATAAVPVAASFSEPGVYALAVEGTRRTVAVRRPADLTVAGLAVDRDRVDPGGSVTVTATVRNDADRPGRTTLTVARDGTTVEGRTLHIDAGSERTVTVRVRVPEGRHRVTAGNRSVTVTGGDAETTGDGGGAGGTDGTGAGEATARDTTPGGVTPGVGAVGVGLALAAVLWLARVLDR